MIKTSELALIKEAAFKDELVKLGTPGMIAKFLTRQLPKMLKKSFPKIVKKVKLSKGVTGSASRFLTSAKAKKMSTGELFSKGIEGAAKRFGTVKGGVLKDFTKADLSKTLKNGPQMKGPRKFLHSKKTRTAIGKHIEPEQVQKYTRFIKNPLKWAKELPGKWTGELATNLNTIREYGTTGSKTNIGKGVGKYLKREINLGRTFVKDGYKYKRNVAGQVLGQMKSPVVGMSALSFATGGKDKHGKKVGLVKRTGKAVGEGALWGLAPGIATASIVPSMFMGAGRKQPKQQI